MPRRTYTHTQCGGTVKVKLGNTLATERLRLIYMLALDCPSVSLPDIAHPCVFCI